MSTPEPDRAAPDATPVEVVRLNPAAEAAPAKEAAGRAAARRRPEKRVGEEGAWRRRLASALAGWLRDGAAPEARDAALDRAAPAPAPTRRTARPAPRPETPRREVREDAPPQEALRRSTPEPEAPTPEPAATDAGASEAAPSKEAEGAEAAAQLALRIALFGGEISEQRYGPTRRWALLDRHGAALETPDGALARALIAAGRLRLNRFERGAAVWRLTPETGAPPRAAYREGPPETA